MKARDFLWCALNLMLDDEEALAREFEIVSIPTLIVLKNGKVHKKVVGARNKEQLLALLES